MKRYILPIFLSAVMMLPLGVSAQSRSNYHRGGKTTERTTGNARPGGNSRPGNSSSSSSRPGNNHQGYNKDDKRDHDKGHGNHNNGHNHGNWNGNNHGNGNWNGNSHNRPGGSHHKPSYPPHHPGGKPGHHSPAWGHGSSINAPGHSYRPHHHHPHLGYMVNHAIRGGRYDNVWMVAPGQYAVRFYRNGCYYMQYIWPETGRYGTPFRIVMSAPGQWYAYGNRNQWYYDDGATLRISLNGSYLDPWTLVPSIELNINL